MWQDKDQDELSLLRKLVRLMKKVGASVKVPIAPNYRGVCLQNTSKPHSYHLKIW